MNLTSVVSPNDPVKPKSQIVQCWIMSHEQSSAWIWIWIDGRTGGGDEKHGDDGSDQGMRAGNCHPNERQPAGDHWPQVELGIPSNAASVPETQMDSHFSGVPLHLQWIKWVPSIAFSTFPCISTRISCAWNYVSDISWRKRISVCILIK